jgi:hypothetical protein
MQDVLKIMRTKEELKNTLVKSLFNWIRAYNISLSSFFLSFFFFGEVLDIWQRIFLKNAPFSILFSTLIFLCLAALALVRESAFFVIQELDCCAGSEFEQQRCAFGSL